MNNTNLENVRQALNLALRSVAMVEKNIELAEQQLKAATAEPETIAVEIHDNREYERGQKDGLTIARHFIRNWLREHSTATSSTARYLAGDFDQGFFPETILPSGMPVETADKRFPWEIQLSPDQPESNAGPELTGEQLSDHLTGNIY